MTIADNTLTPAHRAVPSPQRPHLRWRGVRTIVALILREMTTTYGRSPGGYFWAVVQPVAMIMMLTLAFSLLLRQPSLGTNFVLFYASGFLPLRMFVEVSGVVSKSMSFNRALLGYPRVTFVDSIIARAILAVMTQLMVFAIVMGGTLTFLDVRVILDFGPIVTSLCMAIMLALGAGIMNCFLFLALPIWTIAWRIATRPLLLISGVFYIMEDLPPQVQDVLWWNPVIHISGMMRAGIYATYDPAYISVIYVAIFAAVPAILGLLLLRQYNRDVMYL